MPLSAVPKAPHDVRLQSETICTLRPACAEDEEIIYKWRNLPEIVERGLHRSGVGREEHRIWYGQTLRASDRELFIIIVQGQPAGAVRYDFDLSGQAEISIYLVPPYTGHGFGTQALEQSLPETFVRRRLHTIRATVRNDNKRSLTFFRSLGFLDVETGPDSDTLLLKHPEVPHSRPWIGHQETDAVMSVLNSRQLSQGPRVAALERLWCEATHCKAAAAVGTGLGALRLALFALGVGPGSEVILPAYSCVALANAVLALGATPVCADIQADDWTLSADDVKRKLTKRTKAIIAVHLFGHPADIKRLAALEVPVIEDCAHGIGGTAGGVPFGSGAQLSVGSFYATKMLCAGEGGMVASQHQNLIDLIIQSRDYSDQQASAFRLNDKLTDIQAALAIAQLQKLDEILELRQAVAQRYHTLLRGLVESGLIALPLDTPGRIWYRYAIQLKQHLASTIGEHMRQFRVRAELPVHDWWQPASGDMPLPATEDAFKHLLSLPLYPHLSELEQRLVVSSLCSVLTS
jgi:perosamine synthetase